MPLTRQKIREILDQNAKTINAFNVQNGGNVRIRMSTQIYGPDDRTKLKAHVLMVHATQSFLVSSQLGIGIAFHPEGKTGRINMNRNPKEGEADMSIDFSRDRDGNIVIGGNLTYKEPLVMLTRANHNPTPPAANGFRRGECLVTVCWRDALPRAIPDCRDRKPARQLRRTNPCASCRHPRLCHIIFL